MSTTGVEPPPTVQPVNDEGETTTEEGSDSVPDTRRSSMVVVVVGVAIGLGIAGLVIWVTGGDNNDASPPPTVSTRETAAGGATTVPATTVPAAEFDPVDLVVAYGRSRTENHALVGEFRRNEEPPLPVRRALMGDRSIDQVGATAAVTQAGETRQCEFIDGQWLCAPPLPAIGSELDVQGFATLLLTEEPPYQVFDVGTEPPTELSSITSLGPVTCWSMVSEARRDRARFGAESTLCFHDEGGALIGRKTETSGGTDVFVATELRSDVTVTDVEPSR